MPTIETRLARLEAPHIQTGPVLIMVSDERTPEQEQEIRSAREAGRPIVFVTAIDWDL